jgi:hypothetical protein
MLIALAIREWVDVNACAEKLQTLHRADARREVGKALIGWATKIKVRAERRLIVLLNWLTRLALAIERDSIKLCLLQRFQEKCVAVFRPEPRQNK